MNRSYFPFRNDFTQVVLSVLLLASSWFGVAARAADDESVPADTCILELNLPEGATIVADGVDYGTKREIIYRPLELGRRYSSAIQIKFPIAQQEQHTLILEGGRRIRLASLSPSTTKPNMVLQTGHSADISCWTVCPKNRFLLTGSHDGTAILWDIAMGRKLRLFSAFTDAVSSVAFDHAGHYILVGGCDCDHNATTILYEMKSGRITQTFSTEGYSPGSCVFSPDDRRVLILSGGGAVLFDALTGRRLYALDKRLNNRVVAFSPDGTKALVVGGLDEKPTAILWDTKTGRELHTFVGTKGNAPIKAYGHIPKGVYDTVAFSPDGRRLLTGEKMCDLVILWDVISGKKMHSLRTTGPVRAVGFDEKGKRAIVTCYAGIEKWNAETGQKVGKKQTFTESCFSCILEPNGEPLCLTDENGCKHLVAPTKNEVLLSFPNACQEIGDVAFDSTAGQFLIAWENGRVTIWSTTSGRLTQTLPLENWDNPIGNYPDMFAAFSCDGRYILYGGTTYYDDLHSHPPNIYLYSAVLLWSMVENKVIQKYENLAPRRAAFGNNSQQIVLARPILDSGKNSDLSQQHIFKLRESAVTVLDVKSKKVLKTFPTPLPEPSFAVSPDGRYLLVAGIIGKTPFESSATLWDITSETICHTFETTDDRVLAISSDNRTCLTGGGNVEEGNLILWSVKSGQRIHSCVGHTGIIYSACFSPDGRQVLSTSADGTAIVWDTNTGQRLHTLRGHTGEVYSGKFSPNGNMILTCSVDGTARLWDASSGRELVKIAAWWFDQNTHNKSKREREKTSKTLDWLVTTPEGLFDGSAGGREKVMFRVGGGLNVVPVDRFFQDFYFPGLLAAIWRGERPLPKVEMGESLPPRVKIVAPEKSDAVENDRVTVVVEATDEGGGIRGPWLVQNGARVLVPEKTRREGKKVTRTFDISLVGGENKLEFRASSADGSWESEPAEMTLRYERPLPKPELYLLSVGVNRYADESLDLGLAAGDARAMAGLFEQRGPALYKEVHTTTLLDKDATAAAILESLRRIAQHARPQDTVAVFLAGRGAVVGRQYYFLPHEFQQQADSLEADVAGRGLSAVRIQEALVSIPALKRIVVFDTGQSGGQVGLARTARDPFAFRGAIERLSRASGAFMIASAAVSDEAQEVPDLKHGVLTYALLAGLHAAEGGPLEKHWIEPKNKDRVADVLDWFGFASAQVPRLTKRYFGRQQELQHSSLGTSFPVLPVPSSPESPQIALADHPSTRVSRPKSTAEVSGSGDANLHLISVGINQYHEESMNLKFARVDARAMAELFRNRGKRQYHGVSTTEILDAQATKQGILDALEKAASKARPEDTLVVFLSGHGHMVGQRYYLIPHEFHRQNDEMDEDIRHQGLPADVLADAISKSPARKRLLIFDTCASGGALKISRQGEASFGFRGAIEKLGQRQGVFAIAASAAGQEAQEIESLGHGVLTYTLLAALRAVPPGGPLEGMTVGPNGPEGIVDVLDWFSFASGHVPRLTEHYLSQVQEVQTSAQGSSFPLLSAWE